MLVVAFAPLSLKADWVSLDKNNSSGTQPKVTILSDDDNSMVLQIDISGFDLNDFVTPGKTYQSVDLLTEIFTTKAGFPEVPYMAKTLAIPDQAAVSYEILETGTVQTFSNIYLPPARESWIEGQPETDYIENGVAYQSDEIFPKELVRIEPPSVFRDFRIARVSFFPLRYNPAKMELQLVNSIKVKISFGEGEVINPKTSARKPIAPSFGKLYRSFLFNYQNVLDKYYGGKEEGYELMLCIMPDMFVESFQVYADWNRQSGTDIHITKFTDINANANNPDIIKNHILDAYNNWENPPTYVLIVGDDGVFPKKIVTYDYSFPNEDFFVELEGNDHFPEAMIGRFTNQGDYRMQVMINKYMKYEKEPYVEETDWYKKGIVCSNNAYPSQIETKRFAAERMLVDGGFTSVDTMMSDGNGWGSGCTYDVSDIMNAVNDGRSYLNYRGEGWTSGWSASCYGFDVSDVSSLNNGQKFTFVTSIGCGVAMFDGYGGNCFGEEWIQLGTISEPRGGVAFIGPTSNTHTTYNNRIDKGIYVGMFKEGMDTPGQALLRGKLYMFNVFGGDYWVEYHYRVFSVLGDPSLHIWKDIPLAVNVDHPASITVGSQILEVAVTFESNGQPVDTCEVCITGEDVYVKGISDSEGKIYVELAPEINENLIITIRGGNVIPYQGIIEVTQPYEHIQPEGEPVIVDMDGNSDGLVNPNENCSITYTLKNWGNQSASGIEATLTSTNTDLLEVTTTSPVNYGNLEPGSSTTGSPFEFYINPNCPVGEMITVQLHVSSTTSSWDFDFDIEVKGCQLDFNNFVVVDSDAPVMNYRMDPGETVNLFLSIINDGEDYAPDVTAVLSSNDPYITITDAEGYFGTLNINDIGISEDDYYIVSVDASCPAEYWAEYSLTLSTQNGNYPYIAVKTISLPVGFPVTGDYTGPDDYGYYAYASSDGLYDQTPVFDWFELDGVGTPMYIPNVTNYTQTVALPFTFQYYGIDYNNLRISTDGWIAFGSGNQTNAENAPLPHNDNIDNMVAPFWDDLYDDEFIEGEVLYFNDNANHRFIVQWDSLTHNDYINEPVREVFQAILFDPAYYVTASGDGEIIFQYLNVEDATNNTVGIENNIQDDGLQYVFNTVYDPTAADLENNLAIKFTTEPPHVSLITSDGEEISDGMAGRKIGLEQNHPNPFKTNTWINYHLIESTNVNLAIYNVNGELIRTLNDEEQSAGKHSVEWDGLNDAGIMASQGVYFCRLKTENKTETLKMFKLK
jgi:hypothetical protein